MGYIAENYKIHKKARKAIVPYSWRDASAWSLIAELVRRSNEGFLIYDCPYADGIPETVWYLNTPQTASNPQGETKLRINNGGSVTPSEHESKDHFCQINQGLPSKAEARFAVLDMILSPTPKQIVMELESCLRGEMSPELSPPTKQGTIGARVISASLNLFLHSNNPLLVSGFLYDGVDPRTELLSQFSSLPAFTGNQSDLAAFDQFFFIWESAHTTPNLFDQTLGAPILAINLNHGIAYTHHSEINLMNEYQANNHNIECVAFELIKTARMEAKTA